MRERLDDDVVLYGRLRYEWMNRNSYGVLIGCRFIPVFVTLRVQRTSKA